MTLAVRSSVVGVNGHQRLLLVLGGVLVRLREPDVRWLLDELGDLTPRSARYITGELLELALDTRRIPGRLTLDVVRHRLLLNQDDVRWLTRALRNGLGELEARAS